MSLTGIGNLCARLYLKALISYQSLKKSCGNPKPAEDKEIATWHSLVHCSRVKLVSLYFNAHII